MNGHEYYCQISTATLLLQLTPCYFVIVCGNIKLLKNLVHIMSTSFKMHNKKNQKCITVL